jgi:hypothetical protein
MTPAEIKALPPTLDAKTLAEMLDVHVWTLYEAVKHGTCPVEPLRVGRKLRWPTALVLRALGLGED